MIIPSQSQEEHMERHIKLHKALDELFADYVQHHPDEINFTEKPIIDLIKWSNQQTINPTEM